VSDTEFATQTVQVLVSGQNRAERVNLLAGVVQRQLARAASRFDTGGAAAGLPAITGALYLLRSGELHPEMLRGGEKALSAAADETARLGNEGRSVAGYRMLSLLLGPGPERRLVEDHLAALAQWTRTLESAGVMRGLGARQRTTAERSLFEPSLEALNAAHRAAVAWMEQSLSVQTPELPIAPGFDPDEMVEALRARFSGAFTLVALYLRHGDVDGAWRAVTTLDPRLVPRGLAEVLERAAQDRDAAAWLALFRKFDAVQRANTPETALDPALARAAAWGTAVELYRLDPADPLNAKILASQVCDYGMAEVAPAVLAPALTKHPRSEDLSQALALVLRAIVAESEIGQPDAARRAFRVAEPLLALSRSPSLVRRVSPSAARLAYVMGALEAQIGELGRARPHLEVAVRESPSVETLMLLAGIDRQRGAHATALDELGKVVLLARGASEDLTVVAALLATFEIERASGDTARADMTLRKALDQALLARRAIVGGPGLARAERMLARILEYYGDHAGARRATERAFEAARSDPREMAATVLDAGRRALSARDLRGAREAVQQGMEAGLGADDLVYVTLWLLILERTLAEPDDGTVAHALASLERTSAWAGRLRAWGRGRISSAALLGAARTLPERIEAAFYTAFDQGNGAALDRALDAVAQSQAIDLVEVTIARDWLAMRQGKGLGGLPKDIEIP
jgi:tetratricopeptide (TPR) repeat protein